MKKSKKYFSFTEIPLQRMIEEKIYYSDTNSMESLFESKNS